jgi:hypothetical protein
MADQSPEVAAAIREHANQVDTLGNAIQSAAETIAQAIRSLNTAARGVSDSGTFT